MIKPRLLLLVLSMLPTFASAQIYKCEIGGATHYQQKPCPGAEVPFTGGVFTLYEAPDYRPFRRVIPSPPTSPQAQRSAPYQSSLEQRNARVQAQARGEIVPGMTVGQLYAMLGEPNLKRDVTRTNGERCEYWSWVNPRFSEKDYYSATVCDGKVR